MSELRDLRLLAPELALFLTAIAALVVEIVTGRAPVSAPRKSSKLLTGVVLAGLSVALLYSLLSLKWGPTEALSRTLVIDPVSQFFKVLLVFLGMISVLLAAMSREVRHCEKAEMHALLVLGTLGMCIMASAVHFLLLYLAFEMVGVTCYVLAAFKRKSGVSSEAGVKLFVHGALTSVLFAIGIVMLYGFTKSFNILDMRTQLAASATQPLPVPFLWVSFGLIFSAVAARLAVFPFQFLVPDVIEGSPSPVSAYVSVSSNIAAVAFALRLCVHIFSLKAEGKWMHLAGFQWPELITGVAAVSMTFGNLTALHQTNLKRLIGYSCIAQMGYVLMGMAVSNNEGLAAVLFSLATYGIMTLGAFFIIQMVSDHAGSESIDILKGLVWRNPWEGVVLCLFLLGLAGLPPLVGFIGKFYVLGVVVHEKLYWLSIVAAANWVIGLTYYLSMIRQVFAQPPGRAVAASADGVLVAGPLNHAAIVVLLLPTLALGFYWDPLMNYILHSLSAVTW